MAFAASKYNNIAAWYFQVMKRDSNGYPIGVAADPENTTPNTTYSAYVVDGLVSYDPSIITYPIVTNQGGQKVISRTRVAATDYGTPVAQFSQRDETFEALVTNSAVDTATNTTRTIRGANANQQVWNDFMVLVGIQVTNSETGFSEWDHYAVLNTEIAQTTNAGAAQITGDATNPNPLDYSLTPSLSLRDITGELISGLATSVNGGEDAITYFRTSNPVAVSTFIADGAATTFTLPYLPISSDVTINASPNHATINGTVTALSAVDTSTGQVTLSAAGTTGDIVVVSYETNFVPSS